MAYSSIVKPTDYFNTVLYTGNGSTQSITGVGFQPDWVWLKKRNASDSHYLQDAVRGATKAIKSNSTDAEATDTDSVTSFDSDGFSLGNSGGYNNNTDTFAAWNWLGANGTASNSNGSITSTVSANTTAGFSIGTYTGTGSNATIGHGLGSTPSVIFVKKRNSAGDWNSFHSSLGNTGAMQLDHTGAFYTNSTIWNDTSPTSSVFSVGTWTYTNNSSDTYVFYAFAEKKGYSKFGSYTGNGNADGTFVYTGFKPAFLLFKKSSATENWYITDNKREPFNDDAMSVLYPNLNNAEGALSDEIDLLSNGFKMRGTNSAHNTSGATYIYMAIAENPFVGNDSGTAVPVVAR